MKPHSCDRKKACLPKLEDVVSVCMLALALLNRDDAANTRLDDVLAELVAVTGKRSAERRIALHKAFRVPGAVSPTLWFTY